MDEYGRVTLSNSSLELLLYAKKLLADLGIEAAGPYLNTRRGTPMRCPRTGQTYQIRKDVYYIRVRTGGLLEFYREVGFTITRKQKRFEEKLRRGLLLP